MRGAHELDAGRHPRETFEDVAELREALAQCARVMCLYCMSSDHTNAQHERMSDDG